LPGKDSELAAPSTVRQSCDGDCAAGGKRRVLSRVQESGKWLARISHQDHGSRRRIRVRKRRSGAKSVAIATV